MRQVRFEYVAVPPQLLIGIFHYLHVSLEHLPVLRFLSFVSDYLCVIEHFQALIDVSYSLFTYFRKCITIFSGCTYIR